MKLHTLPNLVAQAVTATDDVTMGNTINTRPAGMSKEDFRKWCTESTTQGNFISAWEGINPYTRINSGNPPKMLHGIIADYDSSAAASNLQSLPTSTAHLPTWAVDTFSPGKIRLIWPFEKPVNVSNPKVTEAFLKELNETIKISDALPGFDESSWKDSQTFELGTRWNLIQGATPIPQAMLAQCLMAGGLKAKIQVDDSPVIPMEVIAAEVERQFPGRWKGTFQEGARGPLFWINDGIDRVGCAVAENGMICYSDRAPSNFMPWWAVLGRKFVEEYEREMTGKAAEMFYFDGRVYWTNSLSDKWVFLQKEDARMHLKGVGCSDKIRKGQHVSDIDKVMIHLQSQRRVDAAVPIVYVPDETVWINGNCYLNTSTLKPMQPAETGDPKDWPWLHEYFNNAFDGEQEGVEAKHYVLSWLRRAYVSALNGKPSPGQVLVICGAAHTGKTFLNKCIFGQILGGSVDAENLIMRKTDFNKQGAQVALWRCDDAASDGDWQTRQLFAKSLKAMAANPTQKYHPKGFDSIEIPFKGRVVVTCNTDPESLRALPTLDGTIKDKIMLFKIKDGYQPEFCDSNYKNEERALRELPFFLRWLINDYTPPAEIIDPVYKRFEIKSFHHPELVHQAQAESPESIFVEYLDGWLSAKATGVTEPTKVRVSATELHQELCAIHQGFPYKANAVGSYLKKLFAQGMVPRLKKHYYPANKSTFVFEVGPMEQV